MGSFYKLTEQTFVLYIQLIYDFFAKAYHISSDMDRWEPYIPDRKIDLSGSGIDLDDSNAKTLIKQATKKGFQITTNAE